jgi:3-oxoacyl-[acyl-carrier-protein] synthase II
VNRFRVAVTGIGIITAAGRNASEFWDTVRAGRCVVGPLDGEEFAPFDDPIGTRVPAEWVEPHFAAGEPRGYGLTARLSIIAAREALAQSGLDLDQMDGTTVGVVMGKCQGESGGEDGVYQYINEPCDAVAHVLGVLGPRAVIATACAAGSNAIGLARDKLWAGEAQAMLAGGVDVLSAATYSGFSSLQALSSQPCSPYSRSEGINLGEGAAFLVLEPLDAARARGAEILVEVLGYGLSADAYHPTAPDPTGRGPVVAVRRALDDAGVEPTDVSYVNGHGTGTPANDKMERKVMRSVFGERVGEVPVSSTKSFLGHTLGAAGSVEAVTCILAILNDVLPPTLNFDEDASRPGDDAFDFVPNTARPAPVDVVLSNSYAFGGNNAAVVLSKPGRAVSRREVPDAVPCITGIGVLGALGLGLDAWREGFESGRSVIGRIQSFDPDRYPCQYAAEPVSLEGRAFAPANLWRHLAPISRDALAVTRLAHDDAGLKLSRSDRDETGVFLGTAFGPASSAIRYDFGVDRSTANFANMTLNAPAGSICQVMGLRGPTTTICSGAASGTIALAYAADMVRMGRTPRVFVIAAEEFFEWWLITRVKLDPEGLAPDGVPRPFDRDRTGTVLGSATVAFVVEDRDRALERGATPYCEIAASYHGGDNHHKLTLDPRGITQERALRLALKRAETDPADVDYCASWASGHPHDVAEARALASVFGTNTLVSAPKSLTGDCEAASGAVNVVACALAISEGLVSATANLEHPMEEHPLDHVTGTSRRVRVDRAVAMDGAFGGTLGSLVLQRCER